MDKPVATMHFHRYDNFSELSDALVKQWLAIIDMAALVRLPSTFALAGGSTPAPLYRALDQGLVERSASGAQLQVKLVATDERWVDDADPQSNEGLFKQCMAASYEKQWQLVSLKNRAETPQDAAYLIDAHLRNELPTPFNAVLLGMGTDGHIASLFPGAPTEHFALTCLGALHPQTQQSRMSLSLPRLINTERIWLVITGAEKRAVLESALETKLPIGALIRGARCPIDVFWCP